jgi:DMSO/TMAO reductase YedYZ molybdopterin-dependent catalytic subunit
MEQIKRFKRPIAYFLAIVLLVVLFLAVYYFSMQPRMLYPGEVRNYQGQNLASIADVRENAIRGTQNLNSSSYRLNVTGLVERNLSLTYDQVVNGFQAYQKAVNIYCVEGWNATILWEGVLVNDLLSQAGVNSGGVAVIFYASDGYSTSLPLDYLRNNHILLAYKMNGLTMPIERGYPFELVAESQYGYKWIKWITQIEVTDNPDYLGYWESRGYPNNATLRGP